LISGRRRARVFAVLVLVGAGVGGYYVWGDRQRLATAAAESETARRALEASHKETQAKLDKQSTDLAALERKPKPLPEKTGGASKDDGVRLANDLRKQLPNDKDITVEASDDRVVVVMAPKALFPGDDDEPGADGQRVLARLSKALKAAGKEAKDRHALVAAHLAERKLPKVGKGKAGFPTVWELAGARASSVARFLVEDAGYATKQVTATASAPLKATKPGVKPAERIEIALTPAPKP
jgi:flagellar motor protein MotB